MEGLAAFAVVGNVMQVIDMAGKVTASICQISRRGTTSNNAELEENSACLANITKTLTESLTSFSEKGTQSPPELELQKLAESCCATVREMQSELSKLKAKGGRLDTIWKGLKAVRRRPAIENIQKRLNEAQACLHSGLLVRLSTELDLLAVIQTTEFGSLHSDLQQLIMDMKASKSGIIECVTSEGVATRLDSAAEHANTQAKVKQELVNLKSIAASDTQRRQLLQSLYFADMNSRHNQVSDTASDTFTWVLDDVPDSPSSSLREWLQKGKGIYWVQGKPGSGKSTLTKFMIENEKTVAILMEWEPNRRPVLLSHYFWLAGSELQKSLRGFLLSMVYQVLQSDEDLMTWLMRSHSDLTYKHNTDDWNVKQLTSILLKVLQETKLHASYCVFIDGFDEFEDTANFKRQVDLIYNLASFENIKICISSRPVLNLSSVFNDPPSLRLQDLTRNDIYRYVSQELEEMRLGPSSVNGANLIDSLIDLIVCKAEGVFLWVRVVLHDVRRGLKNQDSVEQLHSRISRLPSDLNELYEDMLRRLGSDWQIYLKEAAFYLKTCYTVAQLGTSICTLTMTNAFDLIQDPAKTDDDQEFMGNYRWTDGIQEYFEKCRRIETRVISCCGGMLEVSTRLDPGGQRTPLVSETDYWTYFRHQKIQVCHRTVLDYLETPSGMAILKECRVDRRHLFFAKLQRDLSTYYSAPGSVANSDTMSVRRHFECEYDRAVHRIWVLDVEFQLQLEPYAVQRGIEMVDKASMTMLLENGIGKDCEARNEAYWAHLSHRNEFMDVFGCRLRYGLPHGLFDSGNGNSSGCSIDLSKITRKYASYLLYCAAESPRYLADACHQLLSAGADPNASIVRPRGWWGYNDVPWLVSPWIHLLNVVMGSCYKRGCSGPHHPDFENVLSSFLRYGARLDQKILHLLYSHELVGSSLACYDRRFNGDNSGARQWRTLFATTTGDLLHRILNDSGRYDLITKNRLPEVMDTNAQVYLVYVTDCLSVGGGSDDVVIKLTDADSSTLRNICTEREMEAKLNFEGGIYPLARKMDSEEERSKRQQPYDTVIAGLVNKYEAVDLSNWLEQEGWIVEKSNADAPRKFHKRYQDDEEDDVYENK